MLADGQAGIFQGSTMVSFRARDFLKGDVQRECFVYCVALKTVLEKLAESKYGNEDDIEEMFKHFDRWAKPVFQSPEEASYIRFGSMRDKDLAYGIRNGQLTLSGYG